MRRTMQEQRNKPTKETIKRKKLLDVFIRVKENKQWINSENGKK